MPSNSNFALSAEELDARISRRENLILAARARCQQINRIRITHEKALRALLVVKAGGLKEARTTDPKFMGARRKPAFPMKRTQTEKQQIVAQWIARAQAELDENRTVAAFG